jgi:hypothetical protein
LGGNGAEAADVGAGGEDRLAEALAAQAIGIDAGEDCEGPREVEGDW